MKNNNSIYPYQWLGNFHKINYPISKYYHVIIGCYEIIRVGYYKGTSLQELI